MQRRYAQPLLLALVSIVLTVFMLSAVSADRGNSLSTKAAYALSQLFDSSGNLLASKINTIQSWTAVQTFSSGAVLPRLTGAGTAPTCSSTALGTGAAAIEAGSTDLSGICVLSPAGAPGATGVITLTFGSAYGGGGGPICSITLGSGTANWLGTALGVQASYSTTVPTFVWVTGGAALTAGSTYRVNYLCIGR